MGRRWTENRNICVCVCVFSLYNVVCYIISYVMGCVLFFFFSGCKGEDGRRGDEGKER